MMSLTDWMSGAELVKHLMAGDLLEFNMVTYSHWGIYVGEQTISTPCSSGGTGDVITGDLVHLTREANAVVLKWVKDQNQEVRKNNLKDNEEDPKEMDVIVEHALSQVGVKNIYHLTKYNCEGGLH